MPHPGLEPLAVEAGQGGKVTPSARDLLVVGAGGFARETAEAVRALNARRPTWSLLGFLDDNPDLHGTAIGDASILGPVELAHDFPDAAVVIATGRPDNYFSRRSIAGRLDLDDERYATIVHPTATVGETCQVGPGSVLLSHADLTADVIVGRHVAVMPQVVIPHDTRVEDFVTLASGVRVGGSCLLSEGAYLGNGACLREGLHVGAWALVGMGSVVTRDVPGHRLWRGVPARDAGRAPLPPLPDGGRSAGSVDEPADGYAPPVSRTVRSR
jgi:sugar O-acyltransferase (sialic acid O-acetyltransferase NeuD family)